MKKLSVLDWTSFILVFIGGVNWGFVGAIDINLVTMLFGTMTTITRSVYILVGVAAVYSLYPLLAKSE
jgi:hypothetical protein